MDKESQIDHMIRWVGVDKILQGILDYTSMLVSYNNEEEYLKRLHKDITVVLHNYRNRYKDVDRKA